jgi:hypothetical protein
VGGRVVVWVVVAEVVVSATAIVVSVSVAVVTASVCVVVARDAAVVAVVSAGVASPQEHSKSTIANTQANTVYFLIGNSFTPAFPTIPRG